MNVSLQRDHGIVSKTRRALLLMSGTRVAGALVPQILMNRRQRSAGEWSVASAAMSTAGNAVWPGAGTLTLNPKP